MTGTGWPRLPLPGGLRGPNDAPFVGRVRQRAVLELIWERVLDRHRQFIIVGGEPGSGKSRLVTEAANGMHREGATVLWAACLPDVGAPYHEFVMLLEQVLRGAPPGSLAHLLPESARELVRLSDTVRDHVSVPALDRGADVGGRQVLFQATTDLFSAMASDRPLVLVLEDMHASGAPTRRMLDALIRRTSQERLAVLATYRTGAPDLDDDIARDLADLVGLGGAQRLELDGLSTEDIVDYLRVQSTLRDTELRRTAMILHDQTRGNPLFLTELWRDLESRGGVDALNAPGYHVPVGVRSALDRRVERISQAARDLLQVAAVVGEAVDLTTLLTALGQEPTEALTALDEAVQFGILRQAGDDSYAFVHPLLRSAILDPMPRATAIRLHLAVGSALRERASRDAVTIAALAFHYGQAAPLGYAAVASEYAEDAARRAQIGLAHEEAARLFQQAARHATDPARSAEMSIMTAESHLRAGDFAQARTVYASLTGHADPNVRLQAAAGFENACWRPGVSGEAALRMLDQVMAGVPPDESNPHYLVALARQGRAYAFAGNLKSSRQTGTRSVELARALNDDVVLADCLDAALVGSFIPDTIATTLQRADQLTKLARRGYLAEHLGVAAGHRIVVGYMSGQVRQWRAGQQDMEEAARRTGAPLWEWLAGCSRYVRHFIAGDFAAAGRLADGLQALAVSFRGDEPDGAHSVQTFMLRRETCALEAVRSLITGHEDPDALWAPGLLALYTELQMVEPTRRLLVHQLDRIEPEQQYSSDWPALLAFLVEAAVLLHDPDAARRIRPWIEPYLGYNLMMGHSLAAFGSAHRYAAMLDAITDSPSAAEHFAAALEMDQRTGSQVHQAETLARSAVFLDRHDPKSAAPARKRARQLAEGMNYPRVMRLLSLAPLGSDAGEILTRRETEVVRLIADGLSNQQIAERLVISPHTAANHVRAILTKTGTANRTQAARWAVDTGILTGAE